MGQGGEGRGGGGAPGNGPLRAGLAQPLPPGASDRTGRPCSLGPAARTPLGDCVPLSAGYLGFYAFYVVTVVLCTWIYQRQRRRSLVCSMPATPGKV